MNQKKNKVQSQQNKEIVNIREEIYKIEIKKLEMIKETKSWVFET